MQGKSIKGRSRISHCRIEIGKLAVQVSCQFQGLGHTVMVIIWKPEDEVPNHMDASHLDLSNDVDDVICFFRLLHSIVVLWFKENLFVSVSCFSVALSTS